MTPMIRIQQVIVSPITIGDDRPSVPVSVKGSTYISINDDEPDRALETILMSVIDDSGLFNNQYVVLGPGAIPLIDFGPGCQIFLRAGTTGPGDSFTVTVMTDIQSGDPVYQGLV